jgi:branched-chain amino acid transport system ATP-binding protein
MRPRDISPPTIRFTAVSAGYDYNAVISNLSFSLLPGEGICFVGSNGSGKTTILRATLGLCEILSGTIDHFGIDVSLISRDTLAKRGIAYVSQSRSLFPTLTVEENLRVAALGLGRRLTKTSPLDTFRNFPAIAALRNRLAGHLSGGERTIVALARALVGRQELRCLLLDEVSAGLSVLNEKALLDVLMDLRSEGVSLLMAEQNVPFTQLLKIPLLRLPSKVSVLARSQQALHDKV